MYNKYTILSYYKFTKIKNIFKYKNIINNKFKDLDIKGIILLAPEGVNISVSLLSSDLQCLIKALKETFNIEKKDLKVSFSNNHIFRKIKIKIKKEILTTRIAPQIKPEKIVGNYIRPEDWDSFIMDPEVLLIDTRNNYEVEVGTFKKAVNPKCTNFTDILSWLDNNIINNTNYKYKKIAMFCTGGIRCEKATSYIKEKGNDNIYHLEGGVLKYLETIKKSNNWKGECFVFDNRVSVNHKLEPGTYNLCFACRMPVSQNDLRSEEYIQGVSCPKCYKKKSNKQLNKYKTRNNQFSKESKNVK
ncbi:rhodanese-related sulfurtransferase [Pelagibacteraceae bacterium]|nr:rhodanese-related sulfurtransferase [Pelagibacteraceae bacterium]